MTSNKPQFGYFLLADISGFSSYLAGVELEHAGGILQKLLEGISRKIEPVFRVQDFDLDSVFAFTPEAGIAHFEKLHSLVEDAYTDCPASRKSHAVWSGSNFCPPSQLEGNGSHLSPLARLRSFHGTMPSESAQRLREKLEIVAVDPYADHPNAKKLQGREGYRLRVGDWRVINKIQNEQLIILVLKFASRGEIYK